MTQYVKNLIVNSSMYYMATAGSLLLVGPNILNISEKEPDYNIICINIILNYIMFILGLLRFVCFYVLKDLFIIRISYILEIMINIWQHSKILFAQPDLNIFPILHKLLVCSWIAILCFLTVECVNISLN